MKKKHNKPIRKISYGPQKTHFLPGMRYSEEKKTEERQILLKLKMRKKPRRRSALLSFMTGYELEALTRLRITSSICAASLGTKAGFAAQPASNKGSFYLMQNNPTSHSHYLTKLAGPSIWNIWLLFPLTSTPNLHPDDLKPAFNPWGQKCVSVICTWS